MKLLQQEYEEPEVNLTSLIDVVFLLLIFFMVSTTFDRQALLKVELPEAATAEATELPGMIELIVTEDGRMFLDERLLADTSKATLRAALSEVFEARPDDTLVIRADAQAHHGLVVRAMDAAAQEGITRLSIAATEETD